MYYCLAQIYPCEGLRRCESVDSSYRISYPAFHLAFLTADTAFASFAFNIVGLVNREWLLKANLLIACSHYIVVFVVLEIRGLVWISGVKLSVTVRMRGGWLL